MFTSSCLHRQCYPLTPHKHQHRSLEFTGVELRGDNFLSTEFKCPRHLCVLFEAPFTRSVLDYPICHRTPTLPNDPSFSTNPPNALLFCSGSVHVSSPRGPHAPCRSDCAHDSRSRQRGEGKGAISPHLLYGIFRRIYNECEWDGDLV